MVWAIASRTCIRGGGGGMKWMSIHNENVDTAGLPNTKINIQIRTNNMHNPFLLMIESNIFIYT